VPQGDIQRVRKQPLIDLGRIQDIGGLESPDIRRILGSFIEDLAGYLFRIDRLKAEKDAGALVATLHKLDGASRTCGFTGINRAITAWDTLANPFNTRLHLNLRSVVEASIEEWSSIAGTLPEALISSGLLADPPLPSV